MFKLIISFLLVKDLGELGKGPEGTATMESLKADAIAFIC